MKTFKTLLRELCACSEAREWAGDMTIEEVVEKCHRGDWLLWLAARVRVESRPLTLATGHCANTVRHLMKNERSIKAVDAATAYGEGKIDTDQLAVAARAAYTEAVYSAADAAAVAGTAAAAAKKENQLQTADICRKYIGKLIVDKVNQRLNEI